LLVPDDALTSAPTRAEGEVVTLLTAMLGDADWLIPLVEAQVQYRAAYYGLTAAALLEDVFYDALSNYASRHKAGSTIVKSTRGDRDWDYAINGLELSHKNNNGVNATAVHWDATRNAATWTSRTPMVVVSAMYSKKLGEMVDNHQSVVGRVHIGDAPTATARGMSWSLVSWAADGRVEVERRFDGYPSDWGDVWPDVAQLLDAGVPAGETEILLIPEGAAEGFRGRMEIAVRPGVYFFPQSWLVDVAVTRNNRGTLIPKQTMTELMTRSASNGLWSPMPIWPARYAAPRPPDLYLAQRADFDQRFSPARLSD
jgi:hypothetical protein